MSFERQKGSLLWEPFSLNGDAQTPSVDAVISRRFDRFLLGLDLLDFRDQ